MCNLTPKLRYILKILWKRGEIAPKEQFLLFFTIFCCLLVALCVKTWARFSLRDKRLFEISEFEITRVDCTIKQSHAEQMASGVELTDFSIKVGNYSWLSLSRPRLSRITAYLEVKIWSLPIHENLTTDGKYCRKEEKLLLRSNFSSFPQYFQYISNFKSPITYQFVKCG